MENFKFKSFDGKELNSYLFEVEKPIGIVQITHGMKEHSKRYFDFIKFLTNNNYNVFISDLRGHGLTCESIDKLGYSDNDIYKECLNDSLFISEYLSKKYKNLPLYVIGHSFGSFVIQGYIKNNIYAKKIVLIGSNYNNTLLFKTGKIIASFIKLFKGKKGSAKLIEDMSFNSYAKKFKNGNWLTRNEKIFNAYNQDPYCNCSFPINFYYSMFKNTPKNYKNISKVKNKAKLFILAGTSDPVGNYGKGVVKLAKVYQKAGFKTTMKLYIDYRHEILNELNKTEVYNDIVTFFKVK